MSQKCETDHQTWIYGCSLTKCTKTVPPELLVLAQICTKSFVGLGFAPDPTGVAYSAPSGPLAGLEVGTPGEREGVRGREKEGKGKGGKRNGRETVPECRNPQLAAYKISSASYNRVLFRSARPNCSDKATSSFRPRVMRKRSLTRRRRSVTATFRLLALQAHATAL